MGIIKVRPATLKDVQNILEVCDVAWEGIWQGKREMFVDRINTFPECGVVVGELDGQIEGFVSVQLADEEKVLCSTWDKATDNGHLIRSHNPDGKWLHGVGLAVTPTGCKACLTEKLIEYLYAYALEHGKKGCRFVTRIPGYHRYKEQMSPQEYVLQKQGGRYIDPELRVLGSYGFAVTEPVVIFTNYVEGGGDPRSCGYSVLIEQLVLPHAKVSTIPTSVAA